MDTLFKRLLVSLCLIAFTSLACAYSNSNQVSWHTWVQQLRQEAIAEGISPALFDQLFDHMTPQKRVRHFARTQPEKRLTFLKYRRTRADRARIALGRREFKRNRTLLEQIGNQYGVDPCFIVAFWDIESSCGRFMGGFSVVRSLATLAYSSHRKAFFRKELFYALHMLNEGHVRLKDFKGEWAGGTGQPQFLPSSWHRYAVDYNHDGKKDIWKTRSDVFASIANYVSSNGWQANQPWAIEVTLPYHFDKSLMGYKTEKTVQEWLHLGVQPNKNVSHLDGNLPASIIEPYGGPTFMIFNNFRVIMRWNRSTYYAGTVGYLADKICYRR